MNNLNIKQLLLLSAFFMASIFYAQEYQIKKVELKWENKKLVYANKQKSWHMPVVVNQGIDHQKMIPSFIQKWEVPNNSIIENYKITDIRYADIGKTELYNTDFKNVPAKLNSNVFIRSTREKSHVFIELTPLIKKNGRYQKLVSFNFHYKQAIKIAKKSSKSAANSVLATGEWYKFSIDKTGVYKINQKFLNDLGINTSNINPKNISLYGNGGQMLPYRIGDFRHDDLAENAIYIQGENDNNFDGDDYILFYAKGPDDWLHNNTRESIKHRKNIYTDKAYYFIHIGNTPGKRISNAAVINTTALTNLTTYDDYIVHEVEKNNILSMGQQWQGEAFHIENIQHFNLNFDNLDTSTPVRIKTRATAISNQTSLMNVKVNTQNLYTLNIPAYSSYSHSFAAATIQESSIILTSSALDFQLTYTANAAAKGYLDYIEVIGKKQLIANDKQFSFRNFDVINDNTPISYKIQNASNIQQLWDVTDCTNTKAISNQSSNTNFEFIANGGSLKEYIIVNSKDYYTPTLLNESAVANQNLHALKNVDYVIITKQSFVNQAERIANYHRTHSNLNVAVIPLYQIYNEFGSGGADITAIRDFVKHLYDNSAPLLQYVLLFGDSSYDFKDIEERGEETENIVPTFEYYNSFSETASYITDDFYAIVSDDYEGDLELHEGQNTQDVAISRIPIRTEQEANQVVSKILSYYNNDSYGDWRNQIIIMSDDYDSHVGNQFQTVQEALADNIKNNKPLFNIKKMYADAYPEVVSAGGASFPAFNIAFNNAIDTGVLMIDYYGHGGEDGLAAERLLGTQEIRDWNNSALPLFIVISCEFARFDNPNRPNTAGELTIRNSHGGVAHQIATARAMFTVHGISLNNALVPLLTEFDSQSRSISENLRLAKNTSMVSQRLFAFSFGDPAMHLAVPKPNIKITHMNNSPVSQPLDTIKALSHVYFKGVVSDNNGNTLTDFNGNMSVTIYDKSFDKETLGNGSTPSTMIFDSQESKLFRGQASVTNGIFDFNFVAPKDLKIAYGKGKLSFYADNNAFDKGGYNLDVTVGGINENAPEDTKGPQIQIYMNDQSFIDGGTTNQSPILLAFFEDENGINTSLSAVSHDIIAVLDNDLQNTIVLNEYYNTELDDFTKGSLKYRLRNLDIGSHTILLKAYDTYNNKSEATLNFVVLDDSSFSLENVLNYPNPFVNYTEFWFNHNKPNEPLEVQVQIFTVSGKLVKTINQVVQNTGSLSREITWDGLDDFGQKIGKGVYVFKLKVKASLSKLEAEKYEKLVILR